MKKFIVIYSVQKDGVNLLYDIIDDNAIITANTAEEARKAICFYCYQWGYNSPCISSIKELKTA
jgi:hypothetical protein